MITQIKQLTRKLNLWLFICILCISLSERWAWIAYPAVVNWDENTFFTVAKQTSLGHLPYTTTFENKPPLALIPQTIAFLINFDSATKLRIMAAVILALTALLLATTFNNIPYAVRFLLAGSYVSFYTLMPSGQAWMTELNINFLFALIFYHIQLTNDQSSSRRLFFIGIGIGAIPLVRSNWIFVSVVLFIYLIKKKTKILRFHTVIGILFPIVATIAVYILNGKFKELLSGTIFLPLNISKQFQSWNMPQYSSQILFMCIFLFVLIFSKVKKSQLTNIISDFNLLILLLLAVSVGLLIQSPDHSHQSLQLLPFALLFSSLAWKVNFINIKLKIKQIYIVLVVLTTLASQIMFTNVKLLEDRRYIVNEWHKEIKVASYFKKISQNSKIRVLALDQHYIYWRTSAAPLSPLLTHPSLYFITAAQQTFGDSDMYTPKSTTNQLFKLQPELIIESGYSWMSISEATLTRDWISNNYHLSDKNSSRNGTRFWIKN